jgi:manganese transport protein
MQKFLEIFLSILTAVGGFVEIGELVFAVDSGAKFGYSLLWVVLLGTVGIIVYGEMSGRIAAVTAKPVFILIRQRAGFRLGLATLIAASLIGLMTCAAEIGAVAMILRLLFDLPYRLYVVLALVFFLLVVWLLSFKWIERLFGLLGLLMLIFVMAAVSLHPDWPRLAAGFIPNVPVLESRQEYLTYAYFFVALMSSIMLPYETYFYASGAIEDHWDASYVATNRIIAIIGFSLGSLLAIGLVTIGAHLFSPQNIEPQLPGSAALGPAMAFGKAGLLLALLGMLFAFGGAAIENCLAAAYNIAQFFGWTWGKRHKPAAAPRFTRSWVAILILAGLLILTGVDPVSVVEYSIIFAVVVLPLTYWPILFAARDELSMGRHVNGWLANTLGWFFLTLITLAALAAIPLLILTHGGKG